jgi:hypothetical protein
MTHENPILVAAPVLGLASAVLIHLLLAWITGGARAYRCVLRGVVCGALATVVISMAALSTFLPLSNLYLPQENAFADKLALLIFNLVIFAALGFCYVNFVGLSIASLRIRILQELLPHPEGRSLEKILESYNPRVLIDNRINRLSSGGQLVETDGRFYTGRRFILWAARIMDFMKFFILGRRKGIST